MGNLSLRPALRQNSSFHMLIFSPLQHTTAPSYTLLFLSGITRLSSMPSVTPRPPHTGQAPMGELNENMLSSGSWNVMPSASKRVENRRVMREG